MTFGQNRYQFSVGGYPYQETRYLTITKFIETNASNLYMSIFHTSKPPSTKTPRQGGRRWCLYRYTKEAYGDALVAMHQDKLVGLTPG